jgi:hypothetical protein
VDQAEEHSSNHTEDDAQVDELADLIISTLDIKASSMFGLSMPGNSVHRKNYGREVLSVG